jgi:hypothetical protein
MSKLAQERLVQNFFFPLVQNPLHLVVPCFWIISTGKHAGDLLERHELLGCRLRYLMTIEKSERVTVNYPALPRVLWVSTNYQ